MFKKPVKQKGRETKKNGSDTTPADVFFRNRNAFTSYNIERIRELISCLSPDAYELFHTIPFLLHVNGPDFPGYVEHPISAYGIYGFQDSGFWKESLSNFKFREKDMLTHLASTYIIKGLFLMGGSGINHGVFSGFDYWVVVDDKKTIDIHVNLLNKKLALISEWALETYNRRINFSILGDEHIRGGKGVGTGEGSLWPNQKTIFKEAFYRTFIMIAGLIPVWAVLPSGLDDEEYRAYFEKALTETHGRLSGSLYMDTGNLTSISKGECPGAILWQLYKAEHDPARAFIAASLILTYYYEENGRMPCDLVKEKYTESELTRSALYPDAIIFDRILTFYQKRKADKHVDLVRQSICLIASNCALTRAHETDGLYSGLISGYVSTWEWEDAKTDDLKKFNTWPEKKKLAFDERVVESIIDLYREVAKGMADTGQLFSVQPSELQMIKNKISALFQKKKRKIPRCSSYLKEKAGVRRLKILCRPNENPNIKSDKNQDKEHDRKWSCYEYTDADNGDDDPFPVYQADDPLQLIGWIIANRLTGGNPDTVIFEERNCRTPSCIAQLFLKAHQFLSVPASPFQITGPGDPDAGAFSTDPEFVRLFIAVESMPDDERLETGSMLIRNSWGEIFFAPLDIKHIENMMLQCYKIGKIISNFYQHTTSRHLQYSVFHNNAGDNNYVSGTVEEFVDQFKHDAPRDASGSSDETTGSEPEEAEPFLDILTF